MKENESIDSFVTRLTGIINKAASVGLAYEDSTLVRKLLNAVPDRFLQIVASIEQYSDLDTMSLDEAIFKTASIRKALDLNAELVKVSNSLISRVLLGQRCSEEEGEAGNIRKLIFEITEVIGVFNLSDNIWLFKNLDLQGFGKRVKDIHRRFDALVERIISEHEEERK
ncbi:putative 3,9-dihydroxypterocarpan 6A-monooxygenase [Tanacetum coccineum]